MSDLKPAGRQGIASEKYVRLGATFLAAAFFLGAALALVAVAALEVDDLVLVAVCKRG